MEPLSTSQTELPMSLLTVPLSTLQAELLMFRRHRPLAHIWMLWVVRAALLHLQPPRLFQVPLEAVLLT